MPSSIAVPLREWAVGSYSRVIDGIPPSSIGWRLTLSWGDWPEGDCVRIRVLLAADGVNFTEQASATFSGGTGMNRDGTPRTQVSMAATWPGEIDTITKTRRELKQTDVRIEAEVLQAFSAALTLEALY